MGFQYFKQSEFECKCGCGADGINFILGLILDEVRRRHGAPIYITSGVRCEKHNRAIGGHYASAHVPIDGIPNSCKAADITSERMDDLYKICNELFFSVGDGRERGFVHVDIRSDKMRRWKYGTVRS